MFGIDNNIIERALKEGISLIDGNTKMNNPGAISLAYYPALRRFVFCFGTSAQDASFVLLEDYQKTWSLRN